MAIVPVFQPKVYAPGLPFLGSGIERHQIRGGGVTALDLAPGDTLDIIDPEGLQPGILAVFDHSGKEDAALLGAKSDRSADPIWQIVTGPGDDARRMARRLKQWNILPQGCSAVTLFGRDSPAGETISFTAEQDVICLIAAPGAAMAPDAQRPPTDLVALVTRATKRPKDQPQLPSPLADPRLDFRVSRATAESYEIKAGEFVQIIDVAGRQCSDFVAFTARQLEAGVERGLDPTTTRSLTGSAYPQPGLISKFFDQDMQPMVEVIRDTVGRHDTFNLACTAKYYDDLGYPGHVNCSENFNATLDGFGVAPRKGWPAINFFYNTNVDAQNAIYFDEPWSRAGDYVLLRAQTDLVCASSACPCDVDAANGWNPTDIHVRVYSKEKSFSKAMAIRKSPESEAELTRETGFHPRTSEQTRAFSDYRGFWLPSSFVRTGAVDEYWACRERAVAIDLSALRKFEVFGPDAEALMQLTLTRNVRKLSVGQVVYSAMCYDTGGMIDDGTLFRMGPQSFRWVCGDDYCGIWLREQAERRDLKVWVKSSTDQLSNLSVQGPKSREILNQVVWTKPDAPTVEELGWFRFCVARLGDHNGPPIVISRTGYTGELGFEVWCHPDDGVAVWDAVFEAGAPHGMLPMGLDALDMVRIEAGLIFYGYEFTDQTDPFEAGIGFSVPLKSKEEDFIGREALIQRKAHPQRKLVGLEIHDNDLIANGDGVHVGRNKVGEVTSATRSPILRKNIALCRMAAEYSAPGTEVEIGKLDGLQKRLPATVVPFPFYDPDKSRVRA